MKVNSIILQLLATASMAYGSAAEDANQEKAANIRTGKRELQTFCDDSGGRQCEYDFEEVYGEECHSQVDFWANSQVSCATSCLETENCSGYTYDDDAQRPSRCKLWMDKGHGRSPISCFKKVEKSCVWVPWFDSRGMTCPDYEKYGTCETSGKNEEYKNLGMTASQACCACGGGDISAVGRPFRDSDKRSLVSSLNVHAAASSWSVHGENLSCADSANKEPVGNGTMDSSAINTPNDSVNENIVSAWSNRGLGEHASVASFAAFTLALMTNTAPPSLIRDSLNAALDEVNHATASFEVASQFLGKAVGPGPLPPSSHQFAQDMTSLALGAAREGCVDETLSVLAAVAEADSYGEMDDGSVSPSDLSMMKGHLDVIAKDEGRHSALAWRTVRWACSVDKAACEAVKTEVFQPVSLERAGRGLLASSEFQEQWQSLYQVLIPYVTGENVPDLESICNDPTPTATNSAKALVDDIVHSVVCEESS